jgi:sialic acid synthase SpsE
MRTYIVAELGINHNGDIDICRNMIASAKACGADAVKLQILTPRLISSVPWLIKAQEKAQFRFEEYQEIIRYARSIGIDIFASTGDIESARLFSRLGLTRIKISSSNLKNWPLHDFVADLGIPVILSTGDSFLSEVVKVVEFYRSRRIDISLTHCISRYPAKPEETCLKVIPFFKDMFGIKVGFSDHTPGVLTSVIAVALGAEIIEKHFTLDKSMEGPDQHFSLDPAELSLLVSQVRQTEQLLQDPYDYYFKSLNVDESIIRRSIIFTEDKPEGYQIKKEDIIVGRPICHSPNEIDPSDYTRVIGAVLKRPIKPFEPLQFSHI